MKPLTIPPGAPVHTPWGAPDHVEPISDEITLYNTPSHGGYHVLGRAYAAVLALYPLSDSRLQYAPKGTTCGWFEEDCEAHLLAASGVFGTDSVDSGAAMVAAFYPWLDIAR